MNKDNAKQFLPLVQALADGKQIQFNTSGVWIDYTDHLITSAPSSYRIKPDPREVWINYYHNGGKYAHETEEKARMSSVSDRIETVHFVEVMP